MFVARCAKAQLCALAIPLILFTAGCRKPKQEMPAPKLPPLHQRVYVSCEESGEVFVIDSAKDEVAAKLWVGKRPRGLKPSPDGKLLYVAVSGSPKAPPGADESALPPPDRRADGIAVVDVLIWRLSRTLKSGTNPEAVDVSPDGKRLYVSNEDAGQASVVDIGSGKVAHTFSVGGGPEGVTVRPDGAVVYVTSEEDNRVIVIDALKNALLSQFDTGRRPRAVAFTPDGTKAFVSEENSASVLIVDAQKHASRGKIQVGGTGVKPMGLAVSPDGKTLFVSNGAGGSVSFVDTSTGRIYRTLGGVGARPWGVGVTADGRKLYTANGPSHDVSVVDVEKGVVTRRIAVGQSPWGIAVGR